jgi:hypothetical protein
MPPAAAQRLHSRQHDGIGKRVQSEQAVSKIARIRFISAAVCD